MHLKKTSILLLGICLIVAFADVVLKADDILVLWDENQDGALEEEEFHEMFLSIFLKTPSVNPTATEPKYTFISSLNANYSCLDNGVLFPQLDANNDTVLNGTELDNIGTPITVLILNRCQLEAIDDSSKVCTISTGGAWAGGIISSIIVSLLSIVAIIVIPIQKTKLNWNRVILIPMVAFAVGTLVGDAIFDLIPEVLRGAEEAANPVQPDKQYLIPLGVILISILMFFLLEKVITKITGQAHTHLHSFPKEDEQDREGEVDLPTINEGEDVDPSNTKSEEQTHDHKEVSHSDMKKVAAPAYLILFTEVLHNFVDGLALGGAWYVSLQSGLATTVAIIAHEIPQEMGDFAILYASGFTKWKALLFNFMTALTAVLGAIIGLAVGSSLEDGSRYLLAITAGGFLYVGLTDMIHELHHFRHWKETAVQMIFIAFGMVVMLILTLYGEDINFCI